MKQIISSWSRVLVTLAVLAAGSVVQAAPATPEMLSNACAGCHGTNGVSAGFSMPSLAGQNRVAIAEAMKGFKSGERPSSVMGRLAKGYSDAEIEAMADFFSKQKAAPAAAQSLDLAMVAKGKTLHERHCKRCHLESGKEFDENAAVVAGQWLKYLQIQMADYADGKRKMSEKKADKMKPLSRDELEAIANYYASIK
ncbi:MAG: cytochrome class [Rhodocyclaceae bacterium]|nr:cytochrome class [Rhodocyclaceae bacterium]